MITLHHCPGTRSMRSLWLLYELGIEFDLETYPFDNSLRSPAYLARHPAGRVPTLDIDGTVIRESGAIAQVLCERYDPRGLGRPMGHSERPHWLDWVHFAETISAHCANLTQQHVMLFEDHMRSPIVMKLEAKRLAKTLDVVEAGLTGDYLLSTFTAADIGVGQAVYMARYFVTLDDHPRTAAWYDRISAREAFQAALPEPGTSLYSQEFYPPWEMPA